MVLKLFLKQLYLNFISQFISIPQVFVQLCETKTMELISPNHKPENCIDYITTRVFLIVKDVGTADRVFVV